VLPRPRIDLSDILSCGTIILILEGSVELETEEGVIPLMVDDVHIFSYPID
jgi:hypothetical protein